MQHITSLKDEMDIRPGVHGRNSNNLFVIEMANKNQFTYAFWAFTFLVIHKARELDLVCRNFEIGAGYVIAETRKTILERLALYRCILKQDVKCLRVKRKWHISDDEKEMLQH